MKPFAVVLAMTAMLMVLAACEREGPAERAGKQADQAMEKLGQQVEKAGESLQDTAKGDRKK